MRSSLAMFLTIWYVKHCTQWIILVVISSNLFFLFNLIPSCSWSVLLFEILKRGNFRCTDSSVGVETQLSNLALITQVIDPKLHQHLGIVFNSCLFTPYILVYYLCFILKCSCHFRPVTWASVWLLFLLAPSYDGPLKFYVTSMSLGICIWLNWGRTLTPTHTHIWPLNIPKRKFKNKFTRWTD